MRQWLCLVCGLIYDEAEGWPSDGIPPGTRWEDVPEDWRCPECGVGKADFEMVELSDDETTAPTTAPAVQAREPRPDAPVVIVGSGHAGYSAAAAIREATDRDVMLFTADDGRSYYKPSLSNALARGHTPEALVRENALEVARRLDIRIHTHCPVFGIDRHARAIRTAFGVQPYDRLVLAVGAEPVRLALAGDGAEDVLSVNSLADYERFRARLAGVERVAIIGNGLIGCEFANDLAAAGCAVDVIGLTAWPMDRQLPEAAGRRVQDALAALGVQWHLERTVERVERIDQGYRLTLSDGHVLQADAMLSAVGLRPRTRLAGEAGLDIGIGIRVDEQLRTSDPAIHAVGDCVELDGVSLPYIAPINHAVKALAPSLLGRDTAADYPPLPVAVKTPAHPVVVLTPPPGIDGGWRVSEESGGVRALFEDGQGRLAGFALTGSLVRERQQWVRRCETDGRADRTHVA